MKAKIISLIKRLDLLLFPIQNIYNQRISNKQLVFLFLIFLATFSMLGLAYRPGGFIGFDWIHFFSQGSIPPFYPPWGKVIINYLSWPLLIGLTLASFGLAAIRRSVHPVSLVASFFALPLMWTIFLGQLEGISLFGLLWMPWLVPFALIKPQVAIFAFLSRKKYLIVLVLFLLLSLLIWGLWLIKTLNVESYYGEGRYIQNIGLGWWGLPLALFMIWKSRGDMDMLMLSGCFFLPHLIPYNLLPLTPSIARLSPKKAVIAFLLSWTPFLANYIGPIGWWFGWLLIIWLWLSLAIKRYANNTFSNLLPR